MNVLLLSTVDNPLLPYFYQALHKLHFVKLSIACDSKKWSAEDHAIWHERTSRSTLLKQIKKINFAAIRKDCIELFRSHNGNDFREYLVNNDFDLIINAGTPRKLKSSLLYSDPQKIINIHPGLLPEFRGCSAVEWAIHIDKQICNTAHIMTAEYDAGPPVLIEKYKFPKNYSYYDIRTYVLFRAPNIAAELARRLETGALELTQGQQVNDKNDCYWPPCPIEKVEAIIQKVQNQDYRYQVNITNVEVKTELYFR